MSLDLRIVVPVLDEAAALPKALAALAPLRAQGAQVVVVDGGSTDATWALAREGADEVRVAPRGRASQMNAGAAGARSGLLLFLHADTRLPPDALAQLQSALAAGAQWGRFDVRIEGRHALLRVVERLMNLRSRHTGIATGDQALFVRRELFERVGGYPVQPLMEDVALSARLRAIAPPACLPGPVVTSGRRWERHGVLRTIARMWQLRWAWWRGADPHRLAHAYGYRFPPAPPPFALAVLAKAPVAGWAKTRLVPLLGARGAARVQRRFIAATLQLAAAAGASPITLWGAPDAQHRSFRALRRHCSFALQAQPSGDLGERMEQAVGAHFAARTDPLLVVGTDCPLLAPGHLHEAARALATHDAVMIPAEDGGYVLLGLRRPLPVFEGLAWSTPQVLAQTRERLRAAGARWTELPPLWDVDEPQDWARWQGLVRSVAEAGAREGTGGASLSVPQVPARSRSGPPA